MGASWRSYICIFKWIRFGTKVWQQINNKVKRFCFVTLQKTLLSNSIRDNLIHIYNVSFSWRTIIFYSTFHVTMLNASKFSISLWIIFTPGPYWYFGMTMQIYIIYRYVIHHRSTTFLISLTIVSLILMGLLYNYNSIVVWTKCNVIGWMAPLCIGIIVSNNLYKYDIQLNRKYLLALFVFSLLILIFCGKNYYLWLLTPIPVISIAISIVKMMPSTIWEKTQMIGNASLYILIIHPIVRDVTLPLFNIWGVWSIAFYFLISLLLSLILFFTVNMFNSHNKINSNNGATKS